MLTLPSGSSGRATQTALQTYIASGDPDAAGLYLTNEVFLYRVVGIAATDAGDTVALEDCYSLDVVHVPIHRVHGRRLRIVSAASLED
jgi:hypothetical protein